MAEWTTVAKKAPAGKKVAPPPAKNAPPPAPRPAPPARPDRPGGPADDVEGQTPKEWLETRYASSGRGGAPGSGRKVEDGQLVAGAVSKRATTGRGVWIAVDGAEGELECYLSSQLSPTLPRLHERVVFRAALHSTPHHRDGALWVARDGAWLREDGPFAGEQRAFLAGAERRRGSTVAGVLTAVAPSRNRSIGGRDAWIALGDLDRHVYCHEAWLAPRSLPPLGARVELVLDVDAAGAASGSGRPRWRVAIDAATGDAALRVLDDGAAAVLPGWQDESAPHARPPPRPWRDGARARAPSTGEGQPRGSPGP